MLTGQNCVLRCMCVMARSHHSLQFIWAQPAASYIAVDNLHMVIVSDVWPHIPVLCVCVLSIPSFKHRPSLAPFGRVTSEWTASATHTHTAHTVSTFYCWCCCCNSERHMTRMGPFQPLARVRHIAQYLWHGIVQWLCLFGCVFLDGDNLVDR